MISTSKILIPLRLDHNHGNELVGPTSEEVTVVCGSSSWPKPEYGSINSGGYELYCGNKLLGAVINSRFNVQVMESVRDEYGSEVAPVRADF